MTGLTAIDHLRGCEDYSVTETPDLFLISWRGNESVPIPKITAMDGMTLAHIERLAHKGRNVEHITRVTGYFSKVSGWNKGKVAELIDRRRTPV